MSEEVSRTRPARKRRAGRIILTVVGVLVLLTIGFLFATPQGKDFRNLWSNGAIQALLFPSGNRKYSASGQQNLVSIRTALMLYEDSEGRFPMGSGWMDAIENRITASDMTGAESHKKLVRPDLAGKPGEFGYAINDQAAGKYRGDAGAKTILVYESKRTGRNAHGNPAGDRDGMAIAVDGTIVK